MEWAGTQQQRVCFRFWLTCSRKVAPLYFIYLNPKKVFYAD